MFDPHIQLMRFLRDLIKHDEQLIKKGRLNEEQANADDDYIAVDALAPAQPVHYGERYDYDGEVIHYQQHHSQPFTIDFYGKGAHDNAARFSTLLSGYRSQRLQKRYNIRVGSVSNIVDVKHLTGRQYTNRVQIELTLHYAHIVNEQLLRIEKAEFEVLHDK